MFADISGADCAEQSIAERVQQHVPIAVRNHAIFTGDLHATNDDAVTRFQTVDVVANADAMSHFYMSDVRCPMSLHPTSDIGHL
jgi:hypothetical protein